VVNNLNDEDYISRLEYIKENFDLSVKYSRNIYKRVDDEIQKLIEKNK
jgi:3'-phosphoadenosine 5'-phosphosulfate sulfotransferase